MSQLIHHIKLLTIFTLIGMFTPYIFLVTAIILLTFALFG